MHVFLKWVMPGRIVMNDQTVGFVLKEVPYQEKAVIVSLLTKEGKISFIAECGSFTTVHKSGSGI